MFIPESRVGEWQSLRIIKLGSAKAKELVTSVTKKNNDWIVDKQTDPLKVSVHVWLHPRTHPCLKLTCTQ